MVAESREFAVREKYQWYRVVVIVPRRCRVVVRYPRQWWHVLDPLVCTMPQLLVHLESTNSLSVWHDTDLSWDLRYSLGFRGVYYSTVGQLYRDRDTPSLLLDTIPPKSQHTIDTLSVLSMREWVAVENDGPFDTMIDFWKRRQSPLLLPFRWYVPKKWDFDSDFDIEWLWIW